jgi:hypothetical protein
MVQGNRVAEVSTTARLRRTMARIKPVGCIYIVVSCLRGADSGAPVTSLND